MGKTRKKHTAPKHQNRGSFARYSAILIPIIIISIIAYLVAVKAQGESPFVDEGILYGVILILMVLMVVTIPAGSGSPHETGTKKHRAHKKPRSKSPSKKSSHKKPVQKKKPPVVKAAVIEEPEEEEAVARKERKIISYPEAASGGKYGDAYIPISSDMILKVRSLLARSCKMCKNRDICWEKYKDTMDYQTFLESTECFEEMAEDALPAVPTEVAVEEPVMEESTVFEEPVEETAVVEEEPEYVEDVQPEEEEPVELSADEAVWD